jgi:hypothetical protein
MKLSKKFALVPIAAALVGLFAGSALADTTFSVSGTALDGREQSATATFSFGGTFESLSLTLTNTAASVGGISQVFDGLAMVLTGTALSALSLTSLADPNGTWNCDSTGCTASATPVSLLTSGWQFNSGTGLLAAGNGTWKPYGIVNDSVVNTDGIKNAQHNPYLDGPVTFNFAIANANHNALGVTGATFYFGTAGEHITTAIPEPETYAMLLAGLGLMGFVARRRQKASG